MIDMHLSITINGGTEEQEEKLRMEVRRTIMQYVFEHADTVLQGTLLNHTAIGITGDIRIVDTK